VQPGCILSGMHARLFAFVAFAASLCAQTAPPFTLIDDLVTANRILANEGVLDGYGHVSVRNPANPQHYFLARAGAPGLVTAADIVEYDLDSKPVATSSATAAAASAGYLERFIHGEIYRARPDVTAVVHSHSAELIPFADTGVALQPMHHMGFFIGQGVPVFEIRKFAPQSDMLVGTPELGKALAGTLGTKTAALMRGHGAVIATTSLKLVVGMSYYLNLNARLQYQALQLASVTGAGGKVMYLDAEESTRAAQTYERNWDYWKSRLPK
jgi:ribulose-5-phosphate 4-epimerase/fuculose-1-phosphate aldolase